MPLKAIEPVLSTDNVKRDIEWHAKYTGFTFSFGDESYAGVSREGQCIHLQWHHNNDDDPVLPSVIKLFVDDIDPYIHEFIERGTISEDNIRRNTPWGTHEFGFFDLNKNAIYIVQDV